MHRAGVALALLIIVIAAGFAAEAARPSLSGSLPAVEAPQGLLAKHRVIVGVQDVEAAAAKAQSHGLGVVKKLGFINAIVVEAPGLDGRSAVAAAETLLRAAGVKIRYVEPDAEVKALGLSDSPDVHWDIHMIRAPMVWDAYYPAVGARALGAGVQVAVLDTGIDYRHPDLEGRVTWCVNTADFWFPIATGWLIFCRDLNGHGTHVAGTIAANLDGEGIAGVAPAVELYAVKVLSDTGSGYISDIAEGIYYAVAGPDGEVGTEDDADVLSMSLGGPSDSETLREATYWAYQNGAIIVAAAGNEGDGDPSTDDVAYPARYPWVIAVAAVDANATSPEWSSEGPEVDVAAPGVDILSTYPGGRYAVLSGTSMATPHVSGTVALIQAMRLAAGKPMLSFEDVYDVLTSTAVDIGPPGFDNFTGYGLVDAYAAVQAALEKP